MPRFFATPFFTMLLLATRSFPQIAVLCIHQCIFISREKKQNIYNQFIKLLKHYTTLLAFTMWSFLMKPFASGDTCLFYAAVIFQIFLLFSPAHCDVFPSVFSTQLSIKLLSVYYSHTSKHCHSIYCCCSQFYATQSPFSPNLVAFLVYFLPFYSIFPFLFIFPWYII